MKKVERQTHTLDATGQAPGRLATQIATLLRGKHKPEFVLNLDLGDFVVVENVSALKIVGKNKGINKIYYKPSKHPGNLQKASLKEMIAKKGLAEVLRRAVYGMISNNRLKKEMLERLTIK